MLARPRVLLVVMAVAVFLGSGQGRLPAQAPATKPAAENTADPDLDSIKAALWEWRKKLVSVRVHYEWSFDPDTLSARESTASERSYRETLDRIWTVDGRGRADRTKYRDEKIIERRLDMTNGVRGYTFVPAGPDFTEERPEDVYIGDQFMFTTGRLQVDPGMWNPEKLVWLPEILENRGGPLVFFDEIDGTRCPVVKLVSEQPKSIYFLTLDPRHDYLPLRARLHGSIPDRPYRPTIWQSEVTECKQFSGVWYPSAGHFKSIWEEGTYSGIIWKMIDVQINEPLEASLFEPPQIPLGTKVSDAFTGRTYRQGDPPPPTPAPTNPAAARLSFQRKLLAAALVIILLAAALSFFNRQSRRSGCA